MTLPRPLKAVIIASNCGLAQSTTRSEITEGPYELYEQWLLNRVGAVSAETKKLGRKTEAPFKSCGP